MTRYIGAGGERWHSRRRPDPARRFAGSFRTEVSMKLSARNILKGKITEVKRGATTSHVLIDIGGSIVTSSITNEAADELKLAKGQPAYAVIKASDVMVGVD
jgi:molybdopterin-binding protein